MNTYPYPLGLAKTRPAAWRGIVALVLLVAGVVLFTTVLTWAAAMIDVATGRWDPATGGNPPVTPVMMAGASAGLALLIPWSMLLQRWFFNVPAGQLSSVLGLFRWRLAARTAAILAPIWLMYLGVFTWLAPQPRAPYTVADAIGFAVVALCITPLQAAGEEYAFRGLTLRIAASWGWGPRSSLVIGTAVSTVLFAAAHLAADPWLNVYYLAFGVAMALITWRTGGLEVAVALHAVNNTLASLVNIVAGVDPNGTFDRSSGVTTAAMLLPAAMMLGVAAVVWWRTPTRGSGARLDLDAGGPRRDLGGVLVGPGQGESPQGQDEGQRDADARPEQPVGHEDHDHGREDRDQVQD